MKEYHYLDREPQTGMNMDDFHSLRPVTRRVYPKPAVD
jgi:hypothetical protein